MPGLTDTMAHPTRNSVSTLPQSDLLSVQKLTEKASLRNVFGFNQSPSEFYLITGVLHTHQQGGSIRSVPMQVLLERSAYNRYHLHALEGYWTAWLRTMRRVPIPMTEEVILALNDMFEFASQIKGIETKVHELCVEHQIFRPK